MANPKKIAYLSLIPILLTLGNTFQIIHTTNTTIITQNHKGFSLRLIHRDSPESPIYRANLTAAILRKEHIYLSNQRLKSLFTKLGNKTDEIHPHVNPKDDSDPTIRLQMNIDNSIYFVQLGIGKFDGAIKYETIYLGIDTSSDLIWTQCEGCTNCFRQMFPYYHGRNSHSYTPFSCSECPPGAVCVDNTCRLTRRYGDGSVVIAIMANETFTFESDPDILPIDNVIFGCGINMQGFHHEDQAPKNKVSGLFGMSLGKYSFIKQAEDLVKGKFSYCLQNFEEGTMPPMYLRFGDDVRPPVSTVSSVPLLQNPRRLEFYYLDLRGIMVAAKDLVLPSGVFDIKQDGSGGCLIDTGTAHSWLTTDAYRALKVEVATQIESRNTNVEKMDDATVHNIGYDLCYRRVRGPATVMLPWVTWVFANNANFNMNPDVVFADYTQNGFDIYCLTILESTQDIGGVTILGSDHQVNHRIIYDIPNGQLHFGNEDCSKGR